MQVGSQLLKALLREIFTLWDMNVPKSNNYFFMNKDKDLSEVEVPFIFVIDELEANKAKSNFT